MSLSDFIIMKLLGKGSFGSVFLVKRKKDDQIYAMKRINLPKSPSNEKEAALNEIRLLASLSHPNVIGYKETFCDISTGDLCIVMEYGDGGDLAKRIEYNKSHHLLFEENMIWKWFIQLLNGLIFLRSHHIMHRDLKSANVFLMKNNIVKIGDLNVSKLSKNSFARTKTGTPYYLAPEVWEDRPYDYKCDVWSLGCIIYELCCLVPPFRATSLKELYRTIRTGYYIPIPKEFSNELKIVISWMLNTNPLKRKSAKEILESDIVSNKIKSGSGKYILEMISKTEHNYKLIGTIKMPRNIKDINNVLPHERYKMEENDPFETMKKTIHEKGLLNNYNRELAERNKKNNLNKINNINNDNANNINNVKDNNNNINKNDYQINIKPIIIKSEQRNKYENKYDIFNKNKNEINKVNLNNNNNNINNGINNNINNIVINNINNNSNSKDNSDTNNKNIINSSNKNSIKNSINNKIIIDNNTNNSNSKKNSIKQTSNMNNNSKKMGADTRKRFEKQKFNEIKNEFKNKPLSKRSNNKFHQKQQNNNNNNKPRQRPPSGQPRYNPNNIKSNNNMINKNNINNNINDNNNKYISKQEQIRQRPLSHNNNRVMINNNVKKNIYINNNNNYYYINNHQNNKIKKYEIKNHCYHYEGQKFDMNPYKRQNKANYNKMDMYKYKEENKNKLYPHLIKQNENNYKYNYNVKYNIYDMHMKAQRERVNPSQKQKDIFFQREGKYRKY